MADYSQVIADTRRDMTRIQIEGDIPGLAIALVDGQDTVWAEGFGHTNRSRAMPVTSRTRFSLQSVGKTYTAIGFLIAVGKGPVALEDPLVKYYPEFTVNSRRKPGDVRRITFRQLLSHRGGLPQEAPIGNNFDRGPHEFEEHIRSISDVWLVSRPGERFSYSNLGIDLAGYTLQLISGKPFEQYMADEVLRPLGMSDSTYWQEEQLADPTVARGHNGADECQARSVSMIPAGGLFSTVEDMARFISFNLGNGMAQGRRLLPEATLRQASEPQFPVPGQVGGYGLGTAIEPLWGALRIWHGGGGFGYLTHQSWVPEYGVGVAVLTNQTSHGRLQAEVAEAALRRMVEAKLGRVPPAKIYPLGVGPVIPMDIARLKRLEGTYELWGTPIRFSVRGDRLLVSEFSWLGKDQPAEELNAHGDLTFTGGGKRFTFRLGPDGRPSWVELFAPRFVEQMPFNDSPWDRVGPDKPEWEDYVGEYAMRSLDGCANVTISVKNGYLYAGDHKLSEFGPGLFFDASGRSVAFGRGTLELENIVFTKR